MIFKLSFLAAFVFAHVCSAAETAAQQRSHGTSQSVKPKNSLSRHKVASSDVIKFPDELPEKTRVAQKIKPCPAGKTFCDDDSDYPSDLIKKIPKEEFEKFAHYFTNDTLPDIDTSLTTRIDSPNELSLCESKMEVVYPKKAKDIHQNTKLIINDPQNYMQGIVVEVCLNDGAPCLFSETFPTGYKTVCRQKHIIRRLVVFNDASGMNLETSDFSIPSCCVCKVVTMELGAHG